MNLVRVESCNLNTFANFDIIKFVILIKIKDIIMNIRPVTDLRTKLKDIEQELDRGPVFLTKNGYGSFVLMNIDDFERQNNYIDEMLLEAEMQAEKTSERISHNQMFSSIRDGINGKIAYAV